MLTVFSILRFFIIPFEIKLHQGTKWNTTITRSLEGIKNFPNTKYYSQLFYTKNILKYYPALTNDLYLTFVARVLYSFYETTKDQFNPVHYDLALSSTLIIYLNLSTYLLNFLSLYRYQINNTAPVNTRI